MKRRMILLVRSALQQLPFDHPSKLTPNVDIQTAQSVFYTYVTSCPESASFDLENYLQLLRYLLVYNYLSFLGSQKSLR